MSEKDRQKLLNRIRRIRGQVDAIEKAILEEKPCESLLQIVAACRGALYGMMTETLEYMIYSRLTSAQEGESSAYLVNARQLLETLRTYLK